MFRLIPRSISLTIIATSIALKIIATSIALAIIDLMTISPAIIAHYLKLSNTHTHLSFDEE